MKLDKDTQQKIQEMQIAEQNLQNFLMQKQSFQLEINEIDSALDEIKSSSEDEIYKISGQIMIKSKKQDIEKELNEKKDVLNLRIKTLENQENILKKRIEHNREEIENKIKSSEK
ncbi:prefoldin subunit beta [Candidatus Pacearchaeota archaeon]|nr:prefoldin subunit beta [Candidatus Pacearchaeota archaeon]